MFAIWLPFRKTLHCSSLYSKLPFVENPSFRRCPITDQVLKANRNCQRKPDRPRCLIPSNAALIRFDVASNSPRRGLSNSAQRVPASPWFILWLSCGVVRSRPAPPVCLRPPQRRTTDARSVALSPPQPRFIKASPRPAALAATASRCLSHRSRWTRLRCSEARFRMPTHNIPL